MLSLRNFSFRFYSLSVVHCDPSLFSCMIHSLDWTLGFWYISIQLFTPRLWKTLLSPLNCICILDFPGGSDSKASAYNAGDPGSIHGLGRSPREGNGKPLQYSCLENPMDGGACRVVQGVPKSWTRLSNFTFKIASMCGSAVLSPWPCYLVCYSLYKS